MWPLNHRSSLKMAAVFQTYLAQEKIHLCAAGDATYRSRRGGSPASSLGGLPTPATPQLISALLLVITPPFYYSYDWGGAAACAKFHAAAAAPLAEAKIGTLGRSVVSLRWYRSPALNSINLKLKPWQHPHILYCFNLRWINSHSHHICGVSRDHDFMILNQQTLS